MRKTGERLEDTGLWLQRMEGCIVMGGVVERNASDNSVECKIGGERKEGDGTERERENEREREREREKEARGTREKSRLVKSVGKARLTPRPAGTLLSSPLRFERTGAFAKQIRRESRYFSRFFGYIIHIHARTNIHAHAHAYAQLNDRSFDFAVRLKQLGLYLYRSRKIIF